MYNLFVSGLEESWDGEPWTLELGRCVREYTDQEITDSFGDFTKDQINSIRRFPCIFAYEASCKKDPHFGLIRNAVKRQGKVRIEYELFPLDRFISHKELESVLFDLDISDWEMNRTHWAIKDVNLPKELSALGIQLPSWARHDTKAVDITKLTFDVAFSFPGEVRAYVQSVAAELEREIGPDAYFYDNNYKAQLARPSLDVLLQEIYLNRSKLIVVFIGGDYQKKKWCGIEFKAIREILMDSDHDKVMYIRMDDGRVDGVLNTDGYLDGREHEPHEVANYIQQRVALLS